MDALTVNVLRLRTDPHFAFGSQPSGNSRVTLKTVQAERTQEII